MTFKFTVQASLTNFTDGGRNPAVLPHLPDTRLKIYDQAYVLRNQKTGELLAYYPYVIKRADGSVESGVTDENGQTHIVMGADPENITIEIVEG